MAPRKWLLSVVRRPPLPDLAMAATILAVTLVATAAGPQQSRGPLGVVSVVEAALACGVLVARHIWPFAVLVVSTVAAEAYMVPYAGHQGWLVLAAPLVALYTAVESTGRRRSLVAGCLAILAFGVTHTFLMTSARLGPENLTLAALGGLAVAAGDASRNRRAYLVEVEERARRAETEQEQEAWRRVTEERLRIARDLHDRVGHQLALITVQAGVAAHVLDDQPAEARRSLTHIRHAGREALDELRDTVGVLRGAGHPPAPVEPTAGMAGLEALVASFRRAGLHVDQRIEGPSRELAPAADVTAYRVIQESLTNVRKHAGTPAAQLCLVYEPAALRIVVDNDGTGMPPAGRDSGHGIIGMRERVAALGGNLQAGPRPGGGYRIAATLPLPAGGTA
jgi:signal transduction histidine kinase